MRFFTWIIVAVSLFTLALSDSHSKCEPEKQAMDNAWNQYKSSSDAWVETLGPLGEALGRKTAADKTFEKASGTVDAATTKYREAVEAYDECKAEEDQDCSILERMMNRAGDQLDRATAALISAFAECTAAEHALEQARAAMKAAFDKMESDRAAYEEAKAAYFRCLMGRRAA